MRGSRGIVMTSFGAIATEDRFASTKWACEVTLGYSPAENNDLFPGIFADGSIVITGPRGLTHSPDLLCTNTKATGALEPLWMSDFAVDEQTQTSALVLVNGPRNGTCVPELYETADQGKSFTKIPSTFPDGFCPLTVDSAPSDKQRVYVSGNLVRPDAGNKLTALLLTSDDRGSTWTTHEIPNESLPFIGALHPVDRDTVYVRTLDLPDAGNVLVTTDGGKSFRKIATLTGSALQFFGPTGLALSPDGSKLAFGSVNEGLFVMEGAGGEPEKRAQFPVMCLNWKDDGLYACSAPNLCGPFFIGRSNDEGRTFATVLPTLDVKGDQTTCAAGTPTAETCPSQWAAARTRMRACGEDAGGPGNSDAGDDAGADAGTAAPPPPSLDCDCDLSGTGHTRPVAVTLMLAAIATAAGRRAARRRR